MSRIIDEASNTAQKIGHQASEVAGQVAQRGREYAQNLGERGRGVANAVGADPISRATGMVPADAFLLAAVGSIGISLTLKLLGRDKDAEFVGHWAPTLVTFGLLSKLMDHDRKTNG